MGLGNYNDKRKQYDERLPSSKSNDFYKKKLKHSIERRVNTTFIGAISQFEDFFGDLWGQGLDYNELSSEQKQFKHLWSSCRSNILDNSNDQLRDILDDVDNYNIKKSRYHLDLPVQRREDK